MSVITLASGGLDSTLVASLTKEQGVHQIPLFIDYGQRSRDRELSACRNSMAALGLPEPIIAELGGYGRLIRSGLTDKALHIYDDAFTPGRNMLFLLTGAAYAVQQDAEAISIGLLNEDTALFPDQTSHFLKQAESVIDLCMGKTVRILAPLAEFHKIDVVKLASERGLDRTYSCHVGKDNPCGKCIACKEYDFGGK